MVLSLDGSYAKAALGRPVHIGDEWNIVIISRGQRLVSRIEVRNAVVSAGGRTPAEELHALRHDFGALTLAAAIAGLLLATGDTAFDIDLAPFLQVLPAELGLLAPGDDVMPFSLFVVVAIASLIALGGGQREVADALA